MIGVHEGGAGAPYEIPEERQRYLDANIDWLRGQIMAEEARAVGEAASVTLHGPFSGTVEDPSAPMWQCDVQLISAPNLISTEAMGFRPDDLVWEVRSYDKPAYEEDGLEYDFRCVWIEAVPPHGAPPRACIWRDDMAGAERAIPVADTFEPLAAGMVCARTHDLDDHSEALVAAYGTTPEALQADLRHYFGTSHSALEPYADAAAARLYADMAAIRTPGVTGVPAAPEVQTA